MMGDSILEIRTDNKHDSSVWSEAEEVFKLKKRKRIQPQNEEFGFNKKLCLQNNNINFNNKQTTPHFNKEV
jgi:hypothetical protein